MVFWAHLIEGIVDNEINTPHQYGSTGIYQGSMDSWKNVQGTIIIITY